MLRILLTKDQLKDLEEMQKCAEDGSHNQQKGVIIAQIFPATEEMLVEFIDYQASSEIVEVLQKYGYRNRRLE